MRRKILLLIGLMILAQGVTADVLQDHSVGAAAGSAVLDRYIRSGLSNNLALKQEEFYLGQSLEALKEARGKYMPRFSIEARYTMAGGGRVIEMPIGDLVNPIHDALNALLQINNLEPSFPADIANEVIPFLRPQEHETKLRLVQPIFVPAIYHNSKIKAELHTMQRAKVEVFQRQLVAEIKTAYFTHLNARKIKEVLVSTRALLIENVRINRSLFENHKVTEENVFRASADLSNVERQIAEAEKGVRQSAAYFNFLLNRPLETPITVAENYPDLFETTPAPADLEEAAVGNREEFLRMMAAIRAADRAVKLHGSESLPTLSAVVDYGFQGETYRFTQDDDYWIASLALSWNLFNGFQTKARKTQAMLEKQRLETQLVELESQVRLQVRDTYYDLVVAKKSLQSTRDVLDSRREAFHIISKKYEQGMVPQIDYIQARERFTEAGIRHVIARFDYYIKEARLEQASAMFVLDTKER